MIITPQSDGSTAFAVEELDGVTLRRCGAPDGFATIISMHDGLSLAIRTSTKPGYPLSIGHRRKRTEKAGKVRPVPCWRGAAGAYTRVTAAPGSRHIPPAGRRGGDRAIACVKQRRPTCQHRDKNGPGTGLKRGQLG
jgi:hypothetical protein